MRESTVEKSLVRCVEDKGGIAYKFVSPNLNGVPDRLILLPLPKHLRDEVSKYFFFVECKAPGKKPRASQVREIARICKLGYQVAVLDRELSRKGNV